MSCRCSGGSGGGGAIRRPLSARKPSKLAQSPASCGIVTTQHDTIRHNTTQQDTTRHNTTHEIEHRRAAHQLIGRHPFNWRASCDPAPPNGDPGERYAMPTNQPQLISSRAHKTTSRRPGACINATIKLARGRRRAQFCTLAEGIMIIIIIAIASATMLIID